MDAGILIARLILGLAIAAHGAQRFGGHGINGTAGFFEGLGFRPGVIFAVAAGLGELGGGLLTAAGFLGPAGPALIILVMLVALFTVHWPNGFFASSNGIELPLMYLTAALPLAVVGPGAYSLDGRLGLIGRFDPATAWMVIGAAVAMAVVNIAMRRVAPTPLGTHG